MDRTYSSGAAGSAPAAPASPSSGYPTSGNPATATPATKPGPYWYHMIMEELMAIIGAAGIAPAQGNLTQLLTALRSAGVFQTPVQFDNSTKAATTAFVQRALGNIQGAVGFSVNTTLAGSVAGSWIAPTAAGITFTLPLISSCPVGSVLIFDGNGYGFTLSRQGADNIAHGFSLVTSLPVAVNDTLYIVNGGGAWYVSGGEARLAKSSAFSSSLSTNGYQKLPSGLIVQWGNITTGAGGTFTWTFPIAFPSARIAEAPGLMPGNYTITETGGGLTNRSGTLIAANTGAVAGSGLSFQMISIGY